MKLGVVLTDTRNVGEAAALLRGARARGWTTRCFLTDRGILALADEVFRDEALSASNGLAVCEHSVERYGDALPADALGEPVVVGGQYQNAELVHFSDRVVVF